VTQDTTYTLSAPRYRITYDGTVVGWEFCYQIVRVPSATFYPSVWRLNNGNYILIHVSNVSFVPQVLSGVTFVCENYNLPVDEEFSVITNDTLGLYINDNTTQILTNNISNTAITYSMTGNHSNISTAENGTTLEQFNVAIVAQISKYTASYSKCISYMMICGKPILYAIVITWARGICLVYMPKPKGHRPEGKGIYIRQILIAHVISNTFHLGT